MSEQLFISPDPIIPARIVVGVTGHRKLSAQVWLTEQIQEAVEKIKVMMARLNSTPLELIVLSPLAEGADRLVVCEVLKVPRSALEVVLPLEKDIYMQDFESPQSKVEFEELLSQANSVKVLAAKGERSDAYEQVGRYIVDQCDILLALWNGKPAGGRGGTQEIVQYARETKCPLIWINTEEKKPIFVDMGRGINPAQFFDLDKYNSEKVNHRQSAKQLNEMRRFYAKTAENTGFPLHKFDSILEHFLRRYIRADILALHYQRLHYRTESLVYALALAAVIIAAFQTLFIPQNRIILVSEVGLMLAILAIVFMNRWQKWHNKWIDYRFLTERFRSALFMALANVDIETFRPPRHLSLACSPKDWMVGAFFSIWSRRPRLETTDFLLFEALKSFICEAWFGDQIRYHKNVRTRLYKRHLIMSVSSYIMFGLTICVTLLLIANVTPFETFLAFAATIFPALAASITALRTQREYLRNSVRSGEMSHHLEEIKSKLLLARDRDHFFELIKEAEDTMLYENADWRVAVRFHAPEVPV